MISPRKDKDTIKDKDTTKDKSKDKSKDKTKAKIEFIPRFKKGFLHPRYWGIWCGVAVVAALAYVPAAVRDPLLAALGRRVGRLATSARRRARINLIYCFPEMEQAAREELLDKMFATAAQTAIFLVELSLKKVSSIYPRVVWHGDQHIHDARAAGRNVILLVPHGWGVDIPAMLLASRGIKVAAMFHHQKNPLSDYLWNRARRRFSGRLHAREDGIKPFISSIREGYLGYYLPDEDHGAEHSEFVDFFATYKATLPAVGRLMKVCHADVIPLFPVYDAANSRMDVHVSPPMKDVLDADAATLARRMNEEVERLVAPNLEQYTWILKLLKTRREGEIEPYRRTDI